MGTFWTVLAVYTFWIISCRSTDTDHISTSRITEPVTSTPNAVNQSELCDITTSGVCSTVPELDETNDPATNYLNPFWGDDKYTGKKICRTEMYWKDVVYPWSILSQKLDMNCSLIFGNLIIAGATEDDDLSKLESIEQISGYLVIHRVGRRTLSLPELSIIRGQEFVEVRGKHASLLVTDNYELGGDQRLEASENSANSIQTDDTSFDHKGQYYFLQNLEMPKLISILQHGIYFYDNPGLCYAPFTLKWDDLIESSDLQTVDLYALELGRDLAGWYEMCECRHLGLCPQRWAINVTEVTAVTNITDVSSVQSISTTDLGGGVPNPMATSDFVTDPERMDTSVDDQSTTMITRVKRSLQNQTNLASHQLAQQESLNVNRTEDIGTTSLTTTEASPGLENPKSPTPTFSPTTSDLRTVMKAAMHEQESFLEDSFPQETEQTTAPSSVKVPSTNAPDTQSIETTNPITPTTHSMTTTMEQTEASIREKLMYLALVNMTQERKNQTRSNTTSVVFKLPCHNSCPLIQGQRYCWGPLATQCQQVHKCQQRLCDGSNWCFRHNRTNAPSSEVVEHCCHSECAAGCHGPRARDCKTCLRYNNEGECVSSCPAKSIYDRSTFAWKTNPEGKVSFGYSCVKSCPSTFLIDGYICVPKCTRPGTYESGGYCVSCPNKICPKVCKMSDVEINKGVDYLHRRSVRAIQNCTTFEGDVKLSKQSFIGDAFYNLSMEEDGIRWEDLVHGLSNLRRITGALYISAGANITWLTNLTFLHRLEFIGGASPHVQRTRAININSNTHLEFLGLVSLKTIGHPTILINGNPNLCYLDSIDWSEFIEGKPDVRRRKRLLEPIDNLDKYYDIHLARLRRLEELKDRRRSLTIPPIFVTGNGHPEFCRGKAAQCDAQCLPSAGCWGPGPSQCRECSFWAVRNQDGTKMCLSACDSAPGQFTPNENIQALSTPATTASHLSPERVDASELTTDTFVDRATQPRTESTCGTCSPMCRPVVNACHGPGAEHCNGECRWVKDGPYCQEFCPPEKYLDPSNRTCHDCSTVCSAPLWTVDTILATEGSFLKQSAATSKICTGSGNWPGHGGCNFCRHTVLHAERPPCENVHYLECVDECPRGTFVRMINLHHRGGSSLRAEYPTVSFEQGLNSSVRPWAQIDHILFKQFSEHIQSQIASWLINHTQPTVYGLVHICLPCHQQCARDPEAVDNEQTMSCTGPGPEQCARCANFSYQGRCVKSCPEGTYVAETRAPKTQWSDESNLLEADLLYILHQHRNGPRSEYDCRFCHPQCHSGCIGPTSAQCHRCRRVKIFTNEERTQWRCASICPTRYKYRVHDHHTGDIICSTKPDNFRYTWNHLESETAHSPGGIFLNLSQHGDRFVAVFDSIAELNKQVFISANAVGTLVALSTLLVFLLGIAILIFWAISRQPPASDEPDETYVPHEGNWVTEMNRFCEKLWSRGRPRYIPPDPKHRPGHEHGKGDGGAKRKYLGPMEFSSSHSLDVVEDETQKSAPAYEVNTPHVTLEKPNMATLRIITESQLIRGPLIGSGAFGTVFCGIWRPEVDCKTDKIKSHIELLKTNCDSAFNQVTHQLTGEENASDESKYSGLEIPVAIKVLTDRSDPNTNRELLEEAKVMATVNHPCCLRFLALCLTARLQLVTQFMPLGSLLDFVRNHVELIQVRMLMKWTEQISNGMTYLASRGIIHRDLAARNVLIESLNQVRITDFGLAKCLDCVESEYHASGGRMPIKWLAIECIQERIFSSKSDVWSFGVTIWEMCTFGQRPYEGIRARELLGKLEEGVRLPQPETTGLEFYTLLVKCWEADPNIRPTFPEINDILARMKGQPERYLFITSKIRQQMRSRSRISSSGAMEFLACTLTSSSLTTQSDTITDRSPAADDDLESTEYARLQADWIKTLYMNSQISLLPPCVKQMLAGNYCQLEEPDKIGEGKKPTYCTLSLLPPDANESEYAESSCSTIKPTYQFTVGAQRAEGRSTQPAKPPTYSDEQMQVKALVPLLKRENVSINRKQLLDNVIEEGTEETYDDQQENASSENLTAYLEPKKNGLNRREQEILTASVPQT